MPVISIKYGTVKLSGLLRMPVGQTVKPTVLLSRRNAKSGKGINWRKRPHTPNANAKTPAWRRLRTRFHAALR